MMYKQLPRSLEYQLIIQARKQGEWVFGAAFDGQFCWATIL